MFCFLVDANNLYGCVLEKLPLPSNDFKNVDVILGQGLNTTIEYNVGFKLKLDQEYPDALQYLQEHFPLAPTKENVEECFLSD